MPTRNIFKRINQHPVKKEKGFTLVEVIIAVAIIGILSAIAISAYHGYISMAKRKSAESVLEQFPLLIEQYRAENAMMCPACDTDGTHTYTYTENDSGTVTADTIGLAYPEFRAKSVTTTSATLYHYQVVITVTNCSTACVETATFTAIPQTTRGAPAGNIVSNPYQ